MAPKRLSAWATKTAVYIRLPKRLLAFVFFGVFFLLGALASALLYPWRRLWRFWQGAPDTHKLILRIDRLLLHKMLLSAHAQLVESRNYINRINVFPVADGDTGSNMLHTLHGIQVVVPAETGQTFGVYAAQVAQAAILSARGNSGIILAQYLKGLTDTWREATQEVDAPLFARALKNGARFARQSVDQPQRGTILDVFDAAAAGAQQGLRESENILYVMETALARAQEALNQTRYQMPVMRQANVVDAGGAGFLHILAGFLSALRDKQVVVADLDPEAGLSVHQEVDLTYRYCTEAIFRARDMDAAALKQQLRDFGDCLHVIEAEGSIKLHIHTNEPHRMKTLLAGLGEIADWKVDDMVRMQKAHIARTTGRKQARLALVVDSSMDLPVSLPDSLPLYTIPLTVYDDARPERQLTDLTTDVFYQKMAQEKAFRPKTSQPTPEACLAVMQTAFAEADEVICLSISAALSGTFASLQQAAQTLANPKVYCIDTTLASAGITLMAEAVGEAYAAGKSTAEILQTVYHLRDNIRIYFLVENLRYLERGGRISRKQSLVGQLLHIQPLLTLTGGKVEKTPHKLLFPTADKRATLLTTKLQAEAGPAPEKVFILQAGPSSAADLLEKQLRGILNDNCQIRRVFLNPVLGAHVGPGTIGVAFQQASGS